MDVLVLLGPNGVGKSTVGRALERSGKFRYLDLEAFFVRAYASLEAYRADRTHARRAGQREGGDRFPKTPDSVRAVWERFAADPARVGPIEQSIDTDRMDVPAIVTILLALTREQ